MRATRPKHRHVLLLATLALTPTARAGGSSEDAVLLVDPAVAESLHVANHYAAARDLPASNVVYMSPGAASYAQLVAESLPGFVGDLEHRGIDGHVDYVVLPSGGSFYVSASGLVSDSCFPVNRFAAPTPYALVHEQASVLGGLASSWQNEYATPGWDALAFDGQTHWLGGQPSPSFSARRYLVGAMLGYTGSGGNTLSEVLAMIDRSVAADATQPVGTAYYMQTTDLTRSGPRHGAYPQAVTEMALAGGAGQHLFANLPTGATDVMGVMTGLASPDIDGTPMTLLAGSFADHLTSYAGTFDTTSQIKMSRWIAKGASGTAGTVEEPCNYAGKFPHANLHPMVRTGLSLGEAWLRSHDFAPFQSLFLGDPLTRPYADPPTVIVAAPPVGTVTGTIAIVPTAAPTAPGAAVDALELLVDGVPVETVGPGAAFTLDTTTLADGWHELRVLARDDAPERNTGRWVGSLTVGNRGHGVTLAATPLTGDLSQPFTLSATASGTTGGAVVELRVLQNGRVVAAGPGAAIAPVLYGQNVGAGPVRLQAEAQFADGSLARSAPVDLVVATTGGGLSGMPPIAYSHRVRVRDTGAIVLSFPAAYDDDPAAAATTVVQPPTQAALLSTGTGPWRTLAPLPGASGTDTLTWRVDTPGGSSTVETVTLEYVPTPPDPGGPSITAVTPSTVDVLVPGTAQTIQIQGTGFTPTTIVELDGVPLAGTPATFTAVDRTLVTVDLPLVATLGAHTLAVRDGAATDSAVIQVVAPATPQLQVGDGDPGTTLFQAPPVPLTFAGTPGALHALLLSTQAAPSQLPGVLDLFIGAGFTDLWHVGSWTVGAAGWTEAEVQVGGLPPLTQFYLQSVELGAVLPLQASNLQDVLFLF
jgi:uncharacterized protein (TIGR03790 family)